MKTIKIWRLAFAMLAAFSLASCSSDDDTDIYVATELSGTWQKVYDEGVACMTKAWPMLAWYSTHSIHSLRITAPLIYSPPTGQQATPQFIASTPLPMLDICIFLPYLMIPLF